MRPYKKKCLDRKLTPEDIYNAILSYGDYAPFEAVEFWFKHPHLSRWENRLKCEAAIDTLGAVSRFYEKPIVIRL